MDHPADPRFLPPPPPDSFELLRGTVPAGHADWVVDIVHYRELAQARFDQLEPASLVVPLVISFGAPFAIGLGRQPGAGDAYLSFTSGLYAGPVAIRSGGGAACVQVNFTPLGARRFFGLPMSQLAGRMVAADDLSDPDIAGLGQRLGNLATAQARLDLVWSIVARRLACGADADRLAAAAWQLMAARHGDVQIAALARRLDCSRKHLAARFHDAIGVSPKTLARILRFQGALARARSGAALADVAAAGGYADQAHLTRDFTRLSGLTPGAWAGG